jgi:hypothetical protein
MRLLVTIVPLLALGACNVSTDQNNSAMTVQYNSDAAADATNTVSNTVQDVAADIGNDVKSTSDKIDNRTDSDDSGTNTTDNKQ